MASGRKRARTPAVTLPPLGALPLPRGLAYAGAVLTGLLYWLAFGGMDVWPLAFVAWIPLVVSMHRQPTARAALLGWTMGVTMSVAGFSWLERMLETFSGFPRPICALFFVLVCLYQGVRMAVIGWLYGRASARGWPAPLVFCGAFVASELVYPLLFPWYFGASVHQVPVLSQLAELGGPIAIGVMLVAGNWVGAELLLARLERRAPSRATLAACAGVVALACVEGAWRIRAVDAAARAAPSAVAGVVQADMGLVEKRADFDEGLRRHLTLSHRLERRDGADFVVWSETSAMRPVMDASYRRELRANVGRLIGAPAVFGAVVFRRVPDERGYVLYNSAVATDGAGDVLGRYDKEYLLAFGEYLPLGDTFPILYRWSPNSGHFTPGTSLDPVDLEVRGVAHRVTVLICYEDVLPGFTNDAVRRGDPELLVNITNDAWFGDTLEPWQHLALAELRAIEHRRYFVRGTNSGVSAVVDPVGRLLVHSQTFREATLAAPIHWMRGRTVYEVVGDGPWWLVSAAAIGAAFRRRRATSSSRSPSPRIARDVW